MDLHHRRPTSLHSPGQTGPHIYDGNGNLVWCGSSLYGARPTFDFKVAEHNGSQFLTFIAMADEFESDLPEGAGIFLNNSYRKQQVVTQHSGRGTMNMHEFNTFENGTRALTITYASRFAEVVAGKNGVGGEKMFVGDNGFTEIDITTGQILFSWWALDHLSTSESRVIRPPGPGNYDRAWDFFHMNSVDKTPNGDYLISARYTNTIYKISGKDGSIIWRLGGLKSDFTLQGFNMSSQHDARWLFENKTTTVLTFFNNHADNLYSTARTSSAVQVALDLSTMTATLISEWLRPDGKLTTLRGNAQRLANGNTFVGWSENTYISEFDKNGDLVMEAQMASHRFNTYRTYKFNFTAMPSEPIAIKAFAYGVQPETSTTVFYVSWNGATEVSTWRFWAVNKQVRTHIEDVPKNGFETSLMITGFVREIVVEALDKYGELLGCSQNQKTEKPMSWHLTGHEDSADDLVKNVEFPKMPVDLNGDESGPKRHGNSDPTLFSGYELPNTICERFDSMAGGLFLGIFIAMSLALYRFVRLFKPGLLSLSKTRKRSLLLDEV